MNNHVIENINNIIGNNGKLFYLTKFGSYLYGTNTPDSDQDYKGIFLPSLDHFFAYNNTKAITIKTGDGVNKNTKDDIDIQLYSLPYYINSLLKNGDTGALDVLFSITNRNAVLYGYENMYKILNNLHHVLNIKSANAYVGYALGQARKYGIKGSRLGKLKEIREFIESQRLTENKNLCFYSYPLSEVKHYEVGEKIKDKSLAELILEKFYHESYCFHKQQNYKDKIIDYLVVCGSMHQYNISISEFYDRICKAMETYGDRTKDAEKYGGIDWKALSHAVRVLFQCQTLYTDGAIYFPLKERDILLDIKQGKKSYNEVESLIISLLDDVNKKREECSIEYEYHYDSCVNMIKEIYKENGLAI